MNSESVMCSCRPCARALPPAVGDVIEVREGFTEPPVWKRTRVVMREGRVIYACPWDDNRQRFAGELVARGLSGGQPGGAQTWRLGAYR